MSRRKSNPLVQASQGFPGRRKKKVEADIEAAAAAAEAMEAKPDDPFPVPDLFTSAPDYWRLASTVWSDQAKVLQATGRRRPGYRHALCRYCVWTQLFLASADQLRKDCPDGQSTISVKKGDGEIVIRAHPAIEMMGKAETSLRLLEAEFGFTPVRDQDLARVESFNAGYSGLPLFAGVTQSAPAGPAAADPYDLMTTNDTPPPSVN